MHNHIVCVTHLRNNERLFVANNLIIIMKIFEILLRLNNFIFTWLIQAF